MANENIREFLDYAGLELYDQNAKAYADSKADAAKEAAVSEAKAYTDGLADNYDAAGTAETKVQALADGAVAANTAGVAANAEAIAAINDENTGVLKQAKDYTDATLDDAIGLDLGAGEGQYADVKAYVDAKTSGIATDAALSELQSSVDENAGKIAALEEAVNTTAPATYQTKEDAEAQHQAMSAEVATLSGKVGEVPSDKTVVQMIADAQSAATYDDTQVKADVAANAASIAAVKEDVDAFLAAAEVGEAAVDTLKEIQEYIDTDGAAADKMVEDIAANKAAVEAEVERATGAENALSGRVDALEEVTHSHENAEVLNGITAAKIAAWDAAQANAEATAAGALDAAKGELEGKITAETERAQAAEKANADAIDAINNADTGLLKQSKDYADAEIAKEAARAAEAEAKALTDAKAYTDEKVGDVDLTGIATNAAAIEALGARVDGHDTAIADLQAVDAGYETRIAANENAVSDHASRLGAVEADLASFTAISADQINALFA